MSDPKIVKKKPPLGICEFLCFNFFNFENQKILNTTFWDKSPQKQKQFLYEQIICESSENKNNYKYYFRTNLNVKHEVCRSFFLKTLGYSSRSARNIYRLFENLKGQNNIKIIPEDRRKYNKIANFTHSFEFNQSIISFIESKNPKQSHYNLIRSPNMRFISDSYPTKLYNEFCNLKKFNPRPANYYTNPILKEKNTINEQEICTFAYSNKFLKKISFKNPSRFMKNLFNK